MSTITATNATDTFYEYATTVTATIITATTISSGTVSLHARITLIAYCYILPMICVIGIIGNITNLITLASKRLRAVSYMYLRALAVADLLCMIFVLLFVTGEIVQRAGVPLSQSPIYGFYQAHLMLSLINWALATGVLIVVALSLDRFISIAFPIHFRTWNVPQRALKIIVGAYLLSGIFHIPYGIGRYAVGERINQHGVKMYAAVDSEASKTVQWQVYKWTREGLLRFAPILILSVLNIQIMTAFRRRQKLLARLKNRKKQRSAGSGGSSKDDTLVYILGGIVAMFFICNIPAALNLLFINETIKQRVDYQIFRAFANLLEITNHASQFYVFCACSTDYRITFLQKFPCFKLPPQYRRRESKCITGAGAGNGGGRVADRTRNNSAPAEDRHIHISVSQKVPSCTLSVDDHLLGPETLVIEAATGIKASNSSPRMGGTEISHKLEKNPQCTQDTSQSRGTEEETLSNCEETASLIISNHTDNLDKHKVVNENPIEISSLDDFL